MTIEDHQLTGVTYTASPNHGGTLIPDSLIIHYTASSSASSAIKTLTHPAKKVSAHLVIDTDGSITQLVPFNVVAYHAGKSQFNGRVGFNKYAIGIEVVNPGRLRRSDHSFYTWYEKEIPIKDVIFATHRNETTPTYWHKYTEAQISVIEELCELFKDVYGISQILGHEEVSPHRKIDPGPAFPLDKLRNRVLQTHSRDSDEQEDITESTGRVTAGVLNVRSGPSTSYNKLTALTRNHKVTILEESENWLKVRTTVEGWVSKKFIS